MTLLLRPHAELVPPCPDDVPVTTAVGAHGEAVTLGELPRPVVWPDERAARGARGAAATHSWSPIRTATDGICSSQPELVRAHTDIGGAIGHVRSSDLVHWEVQPPLTGPASFYQLEVAQVQWLSGNPVHGLLRLRNVDNGTFVGEILDPIPVEWTGDRLQAV
jgi:hypothetical protein